MCATGWDVHMTFVPDLEVREARACKNGSCTRGIDHSATHEGQYAMPSAEHSALQHPQKDDPEPCPCPSACEVMLHELPAGARATILCVRCPTHMRKRLAEMGILPGVEVQMKRVAPFGDPIAFQVKGYQLSLRKSDAEKISVRQLPRTSGDVREDDGQRGMRQQVSSAEATT